MRDRGRARRREATAHASVESLCGRRFRREKTDAAQGEECENRDESLVHGSSRVRNRSLRGAAEVVKALADRSSRE